MPTKHKKASAGIRPIYAVVGPEMLLKRQAINAITVDVLGDADRSMALSEYDGASASTDLAAVLDDLRTLPFLAERRLVIIRDADTFITRCRESLEKYADDPSSCGTLLLECKLMPANTKLCKKITEVGQVIKCEAPKAGVVPTWLAQRAQETYNCRMDVQVARMIVELVGTNLGLLDAELLKLSLYVGQRRRIEKPDVEVLVGHTREEHVWSILAAMSAGNLASAMQQWEDAWQSDMQAEYRSIGGMAFTVRRLLSAKRAFDAGASPIDVARQMMRWGEVGQVQEELSRINLADIEAMMCRLLDADLAAKSGGASVRTSIEAFIIKGCRRGTTPRAMR